MFQFEAPWYMNEISSSIEQREGLLDDQTRRIQRKKDQMAWNQADVLNVNGDRWTNA